MEKGLKDSGADSNTINLKEYVNVSLVDVVTDKIRSNIYSGIYSPGKRLIVREISEELGVSHTPIKEALNRLVSEGYVVALPRKSMVVKEYSNIEFIDNFETRLSMELYYSGEILERAGKNRRILEDLKEYEKAMEELVENNEEISYTKWVTCETTFHRRYMEGIGNKKAYYMYCQLDTNRQSYFAFLSNNKFPLSLESFRLNCREHREIIDAIGSGDARAFCQAAAAHLIRACADYVIDEESGKRYEELKRNADRFMASM